MQVSEQAVERATGRPWKSWAKVLERYGDAVDHTERARRLSEEHPDLPGWWVQHLTVTYEQERGLRQHGQTSKGDFQVSCSRTLPVPVDEGWRRLVQTPFLEGVVWREGETADTPEAGIEVRRVDPPHVLRWFWLDGRGKSTVEVSLQDRGQRCTITFRHHGMPDAKAREAARARWKAVLAGL